MRRAEETWTAALLVAAVGGPAWASEDAAAARARLRAEPTVTDVQRAAVRAAGLDADEAGSWRRRINVSALLPQVRLRAYRSLDNDRSLELEPGSPDRLDLSAGEGWTVEGSAVWNLSRLVWDRDELDVGREAVARGARRSELTQLVARLYFERRRKQTALLLRPPEDAAARADEAFAVAELTARLDGLTAGWFGRALHVVRTRGDRP